MKSQPILLNILLFVFLFLSIPRNTFAQSKEGEIYELFDISLEELLNVGIVSASKKKQSVSDAPATAFVYTEEQIFNRGYNNLLDLLEDVPEIEIQKNSNPEFRNVTTMRGVSGPEKFLILLNGIRITPATGDPYTLSFNYSLANAKRVEVILGPASALYGVDAFSGIINIITKGSEGETWKGADVKSSFGVHSTTDNSFSGGAKVDRLNLTVAGNYYTSDEPNYSKSFKDKYSWFNNQYSPFGRVVESPFYQRIREVSDFQQLAGNSFQGRELNRSFRMPTQAYYLNAGLSFENFSVGYVRNFESHSSSYAVDSKFAAPDENATVGVSQEVFYGKHQFTSFNKRWGLQTTIMKSFYETDPGSNFASAASRWQRGYVYSFGQSSKFEEQFNYDFTKRISLIAGASFENLSALPRTGLSPKRFNKSEPAELQDVYFIGAAGYKPFSQGTELPFFNDSLVIRQKFYYLNYLNYGAFAQLQISPFKMLEVTAGSRFDYNTRFGGSFNPRLGLVLTPKENLKFKLLYGEAFLAPSPRKAYEQSGAFYDFQNGQIRGDYFRIPNPNLNPEKLKSLEASVSYLLLNNLSLALNGYYTTIENLIDLFGVAQADQIPKNLTVTSVETSINKGQSTIKGGTFRVNVLTKANAVSFNTYATYSIVDGTVDGDVLPFAAKHTVKAGSDISYRRLTVNPRIIFRSKSYSNLKDGPNGDNFSNNSYAVLNLMLRYVFRSTSHVKYSGFMRVNNLTNLKYYNVYSGNEEGMPQTPQDPLRLNVGMNLSFF